MTSIKRKRQPVAEFAAGLLACAAAHFFLVAPIETELARVEAEADALSSRATPGGLTLSAEQLADATTEAAAMADRVRACSEPAKDDTRLLTGVMELAQRAGVRVDQLQPVRSKAAPTPPPPTTNPDGTPALPPAEPAVHCRMVVAAPYAKLVGFVASIPRDLGFAVVRSIRLEPDPDGGPDFVRANIETDHHAFGGAAQGEP